MSIKFLLLLLWSPFTTAVDYAATCHETCAQCNDCKSEFNFISYTSQQGKQPTDPLYTCIPCLGIDSETDCESCGKCKSCVGCMACVRDACNSHFHLELGEKSCEFCADYMVCIHNPKLKICEESKQCQHCTIAVGCNAELFAIATDRTYANAYYQNHQPTRIETSVIIVKVFLLCLISYIAFNTIWAYRHHHPRSK